jgi:hypothetical protein
LRFNSNEESEAAANVATLAVISQYNIPMPEEASVDVPTLITDSVRFNTVFSGIHNCVDNIMQGIRRA